MMDTEHISGLSTSRPEIIAKLGTRPRCEVLVVGGGIHGAAVAREAALNGLSTVLLERGDYSCETSSNSSKMAHGGLRYLENFDFIQVFEGIHAREDLYRTASHLVNPCKFFLPVPKEQLFQKLKLGLGLSLYDVMCFRRDRWHKWLNQDELDFQVLSGGKIIDGGYIYYDGLLNDSRLVIENITAARQEGAICLNYADVRTISQLPSSRVSVTFTDLLTGTNFTVETGIVVNCTGPWVANTGRMSPSPIRKNLLFSRGTHVLFDFTWNHPAMILPMEERGRYYFVWPHEAGTMVGTTEKDIEIPQRDPLPDIDEVTEILNRVDRDLQHTGLKSEQAFYAFTGIRTIPKRGSGKAAAQSRRHIWTYSNGTLSLLGGKFTTAAYTAHEALKQIYRLAELDGKPVGVKGRILPGGINPDGACEELADKMGLEKSEVQGVINRFGSRANYFATEDCIWLDGKRTLKAEVLYSLKYEQVETLDDLIRRRLGLDYLKNRTEIDSIVELFKQYRPDITNIEDQLNNYNIRREKIEAIIAEAKNSR